MGREESRSFSLPAVAFDSTIWESLATGIATFSTSKIRRAGQIASKSNPLITSDRSTSVPIPSLARVSARSLDHRAGQLGISRLFERFRPNEQFEPVVLAHAPGSEQILGGRRQEEIAIERREPYRFYKLIPLRYGLESVKVVIHFLLDTRVRIDRQHPLVARTSQSPHSAQQFLPNCVKLAQDPKR